MPSQEKRQQVSTEHQNSRQGDNHQWDVVELPRAVGAAVEGNRDDEDEDTTRQRGAGLDQAHRATPGPGRVDAARQRLLAEIAAACSDVKLKPGIKPIGGIKIMWADGGGATHSVPNRDLV